MSSCCANDESSSSVSISGNLGDYWRLMKPRVMYLVVFTFIVGMLIAPGSLNPFIATVSTLCVAMGCGAACAINMWYDRDIDLLMQRTKSRPIPSGVIDPDSALEFGVILASVSVFVMAITVGYLSSFLLLISILFYVFVYTIWLKRVTPQNIVIGGLAGAFPPVIGWSVVDGSISWQSLILLAIIFVWTPPHFWSLSLVISDDYKAASVPMMPVEYGVKYTKINILIYSIVMSLVVALPGCFLDHYLIYESISFVLSGFFVYYAASLMFSDDLKVCRRLFFYSMAYLFAIFLSIVFCSQLINVF